jgi:hypothetical protein
MELRLALGRHHPRLHTVCAGPAKLAEVLAAGKPHFGAKDYFKIWNKPPGHKKQIADPAFTHMAVQWQVTWQLLRQSSHLRPGLTSVGWMQGVRRVVATLHGLLNRYLE